MYLLLLKMFISFRLLTRWLNIKKKIKNTKTENVVAVIVVMNIFWLQHITETLIAWFPCEEIDFVTAHN